VVIIDTAGIDDTGALGELRIEKTRQVLNRTDLGVIISEPDVWGDFEEKLLGELKARKIPVIAVFNKSDLAESNGEILDRLASEKIPVVKTAALSGKESWTFVRHCWIQPLRICQHPTILGDLVGAGELAVLVVPIDKEAPKGRLILPQVQAIRDLLDSDASCIVVKERELRHVLEVSRNHPNWWSPILKPS
jgi:predicted GTPase